MRVGNCLYPIPIVDMCYVYFLTVIAGDLF